MTQHARKRGRVTYRPWERDQRKCVVEEIHNAMVVVVVVVVVVSFKMTRRTAAARTLHSRWYSAPSC